MNRHVNRLLLVCGAVAGLWGAWVVCRAAFAEQCSCGCAVITNPYVGFSETTGKYYYYIPGGQYLAFDMFYDSTSDGSKHPDKLRTVSKCDLYDCSEVKCSNTDPTCKFPCAASCAGCSSKFGDDESVGKECTPDS